MHLEASDGVTVQGHAYIPAAPSPPGIVLIHGRGMDRHVWDVFAVRAQQFGYLVISIDLRGHGQSLGTPDQPLDYRRNSDADWQRTLLDIDVAFRQLQAEGADPANLFVAGEGLGANLALQYSVEHADVQGIVILSPGTQYGGIVAAPLIAQLRQRPVLLLWGERDDFGASSASTLQRHATGHLEVRVYPGGSQGAGLFDSAPESMGQVLVWLDQMLAKDGSGAP